MKNTFLILLLFSCAHQKPVNNINKSKKFEEIKNDLVSLSVAVEHAHASYFRGCVEGYKLNNERKQHISSECKKMADIHAKEIKSILLTPVATE